jgi:hypothetical protein
LARDDLVERHAIKVAPFGGQNRPVDIQALGSVDVFAHAQDRLIEINACALHVESNRLDLLQGWNPRRVRLPHRHLSNQ